MCVGCRDAHLQVVKAGRPDVAAVGPVGSIRDQVDTELALWRLGSSVPNKVGGGRKEGEGGCVERTGMS
jgi:hypothetical protein